MLPPTTIYLTGVRNGTTDELASYHDTDLPLGLLAQPLTRNYLRYQHLYAWVGIDNGCFTKVGQARFSLPAYLSMIEEGLDRFGDSLLFATAPDVAFDWSATLEKSLPVLPQIRRAGAPAALVLQDGATPSNVPWDELDCVFIGGSTEWKVGAQARAISAEATRRGKWVHMGRVNSEARMITAQEFGVGSADGTHLLNATRRAVAVVAVSAALKATRWAGHLSPAQAEARDRTLAALAELVSPSEAARRRAVEALERLGAPEAALRLARARAADEAASYETITRECAVATAVALGRPGHEVQAEIAKAGEEAAVGDILAWLRTLHRRTPTERRARDWSEYGARTAGHRENPGTDRSFSRAPRGPFASAVNAMKLGKKLPADRYVHRSLYGSLPPVVREGVDRALDLAELRLQDVDLLKLGTIDETVSLLRYPDFDTDPFPGLAESWSVNLTTGGVKHATYKQGPGTPILHRKESFLDPADPSVPALRAVTEDLERRGLFRETNRIGRRGVWDEMLREAGVRVVGTSVLPLRHNGARPDHAIPRFDTLDELRLWVRSRYRIIKCGSFRCVYDLGDGRALKLARHEGEGTEHNLAESKSFACLGAYAPKVFDWDRERGLWLIVERVRTVEEEEFLSFLSERCGLDADLVSSSSIFNEYLLRALKNRHHPMLADEQRRFSANAWAMRLVDRLRACDVSAEDLTAKNWGVAPDGRLVILDAPDSLADSNW